MKVGDLVKLTRDCDYQPQIFRRGMVGIVEGIDHRMEVINGQES